MEKKEKKRQRGLNVGIFIIEQYNVFILRTKKI